MKMNFIKTDDKEMAELLLKHGYKLYNNTDKQWVFINERPIEFSEDNEELDKSKLIFTNVLMM